VVNVEKLEQAVVDIYFQVKFSSLLALAETIGILHILDLDTEGDNFNQIVPVP